MQLRMRVDTLRLLLVTGCLGKSRALNDINYQGPLSVEWEDIGMDREHGATEAAAFVKKVDFAPSKVAFDAAFDKKAQAKKK